MPPPMILFATPSSWITYTNALPDSGWLGRSLAFSAFDFILSSFGPHPAVADAIAESWPKATAEHKIATDNKVASNFIPSSSQHPKAQVYLHLRLLIVERKMC